MIKQLSEGVAREASRRTSVDMGHRMTQAIACVDFDCSFIGDNRNDDPTEKNAGDNLDDNNRKLSMGDEFMDILHRDRKESMSSQAFGIFMVCAWVCIATADPMFKSASKVSPSEGEKRKFAYEPASVIFASSALSVVLGHAAAFFTCGGVKGLKRIWNKERLMKMCIPSSLFTLAQILKFIALKYLPVDVVVLLDQSSLIALAIMMRFMMNKKYTTSQWCSLIIISFAMLQYVILKSDRDNEANEGIQDLKNEWLIGMIVILSQVVISVTGAVLCEKLLKGAPGEVPDPFVVQKAQMEIWGSLATLLYSFIFAPFVFGGTSHPTSLGTGPNGLFHDWHSMTYLVLTVLLIKIWMAALVAKTLDSLVKQLGSCCSVLITYCLQLMLYEPWGHVGKRGGFGQDTFVAMTVVVLGVTSFLISTSDAQRNQAKKAQIRDIEALVHSKVACHPSDDSGPTGYGIGIELVETGKLNTRVAPVLRE